MGTLNGLFGMPEQDDGGLLGAIGSLLGGSKLTAEQQRGIRAATSRILETSGPSRTPRTFMQALGSGMGAFDDGVQSARDHAVLEQQRALQQLLGLKLKDAEADFGHRRMKNAGFRRISVWVSAELAQKLAKERKPAECGGRTLERLLLGEAAKRPTYPYGSTEDEKQGPRRQVSRARVRVELLQPSHACARLRMRVRVEM